MKIGTDIIQVERIRRLVERYHERFKKHFLCDEEIKSLKKIESIAGYWAAKEAISKALGCGIGSKLSFHDIIISKNTLGTPIFTLSQKAQSIHKIKESSLSISHDGGFAIAVAIILKDNTDN